MPVQFTTTLPDEDQPVVTAGSERTVSVDLEGAVSNNGDVRYQIRRTNGDTTLWEDAPSLQEFVGSYDTLTFDFSGLLDGEEYELRGRTETDYAAGEWTTAVTATTPLPAPTNPQVTASTDSSVSLSWVDNSNNEVTQTILRQRRDTQSSWGDETTVAEVGVDVESYTDTTVLPGETYRYQIQISTQFSEASSAFVPAQTPVEFTTTLPDEDAVVLGNGVKDEVAVDRGEAVTNNGDVRIQIRETGQDSWESSATGFGEFLGAFDTLTMEFVAREDGEEYEVRARTETAYVTGTWTEPVSIVTQFPGFDNFQITDTAETSVSLQWDDVADNEDGTRVQRRAEINGSFTPWDTIETVPPTNGDTNTVTYTDDAVPSGTTLQYRIQPFTPYTQATSNALETATDGTTAQNVASEGYHVEVVNPDTGRVRVPEVADLQNAPVFNPGPNQQPTVRVPVRKNDVWLSDTYDDDPEMRVWRDGRRLPIEVLRDVEQLEGATVLIGVGGVELEQRVREEYNDQKRHLAVRDLVETETTYGDETPAPVTTDLTDQLQQEADSDAEFNTATSFVTDAPLEVVAPGIVRTKQVCWNENGRTDRDDESGVGFASGDEYVNGQAIDLIQSAGNFIEWQIPAWPYDLAPEDVGLRVREELADGANMDISWVINGTATPSFQPSQLTLDWRDFRDEFSSWSPSINTDAPNTIRVEVNSTTSANNYLVDQLAVYDRRYESALSFPNSLNEPGGDLDGPGLHAPVNAVFDNAPSAFNVVAGGADITIDDTSGAQRVQISNDNGATWLPDDGTENNTTSVDVDYPSAGSGSRLRVTLDAYEPNGPRDATPRLNYASQELDAYELRADISQELLLIEETFDTDLASVLSAIGEPAERSWGLRTDANGDIVVRFIQNGQFDASYTPAFSDRTREKLGKTYDAVVVKGSNEPESNIPYTASTTFEALPRENILSGSETVYDDTRNYDRGDDYEINYQTGEIRATAGGDLVVGDAYRVDFRYQARGTFESPDAPADPDELVTTVPGVTSQRLAEQVAFVLASEVDTPRYAAEVTIPDPDPRFDPTDALPPSVLGLPSGIDSLEVRGQPQLTETGLAVRFGTRPPVKATQERLSRQLGRVSDRS